MRRLLQWRTEANGPAAAGLVAPFFARASSLEIGAGLFQATLAAALHIIPPPIPPPTWNNEPLTCGLDGFVCWRIRLPMTCFLSVPMVSDHNYFGSVCIQWGGTFYKPSNHFLSLDWNRCGSQQQTVRWQMSRTPCLMVRCKSFHHIRSKGWPTRLVFQRTRAVSTRFALSQCSSVSDLMVVLPVKCSSLFTHCSVAQAREEPSLIGGRVPMCLHLCILPLVMCPGLWMECVENHDSRW